MFDVLIIFRDIAKKNQAASVNYLQIETVSVTVWPKGGIYPVLWDFRPIWGERFFKEGIFLKILKCDFSVYKYLLNDTFHDEQSFFHKNYVFVTISK